MAKQARQHHWVPQFYLRGFTQNGGKNSKLYVVNPKTGEAFTSRPDGVGTKRDFNRIEVPGLAPDALEHGLSRFESKAAAALKALRAARTLDDWDSWLHALNLAALLAVRNPRNRETMRRFQESISHHIMDLALATPERWEKFVQEAREDGALAADAAVSYEGMKDFHERREYRVELSSGAHIATEFDVFDTVLKTLVDRRWLLLRAPAGSSGFATSDHPLCLMWSDGSLSTFRKPAGHGVPGTIVLFPLSHDLCALGTFEWPSGVRDVSLQKVADCNAVVSACADRQVYARDEHFRVTVRGPSPIRGSEIAAWIRNNGPASSRGR